MNNLSAADGSRIENLNTYVNLFYISFGNLGNLFKIAFFLQKPLRALPCTSCILFATISDFVTLNNLPIRQLLAHFSPKSYSINLIVDWSNSRNESIFSTHTVSRSDIFMCKFRSYLHMLSTNLSSEMLLFASINRSYAKCFRKLRQKNGFYFSHLFSYFPNVHKLCLITLSLSALISIHHIFNFTIRSPVEGCIPRNNLLWTGWIISIHCLLLPILMITFGILTLKNLRHSTLWNSCVFRRHRQMKNDQQFIQIGSYSVRCRHSIRHQIDDQLTWMVITEILVTLCTSLPYGAYAFYRLLYGIRSNAEWISLFIRITMYFEASCGFYIYLITLKTLRKRFCKTFIEKITSLVLF